MSGVGIELLMEMNGCADPNLGNAEYLNETANSCIKQLGMTRLKEVNEKRKDHLRHVSVVGESHLLIDSYPGKAYVRVDIFTCGETHPRKVISYLADRFDPKVLLAYIEKRGERVDL